MNTQERKTEDRIQRIRIAAIRDKHLKDMKNNNRMDLLKRSLRVVAIALILGLTLFMTSCSKEPIQQECEQVTGYSSRIDDNEERIYFVHTVTDYGTKVKRAVSYTYWQEVVRAIDFTDLEWCGDR